MIPTGRFWVLLFAGAPLWILAPSWSWLLPLAGNTVLLTLGLADYLLIPAPNALLPRRETSRRWYRGKEDTIRLILHNPTSRQLRGVVREIHPPLWGNNLRHPFSLPPLGESATVWRLKPEERGEYQLRPVYLRLTGPLGLMTRQGQVPLTDRVQVYPRLPPARGRAALAAAFAGGKRYLPRQLPVGGEFMGMRDYVPGDDVRGINWKATARRGRPLVNQFREEGQQHLLIALDAGQMMLPRLREGGTRFDWAMEAALSLAQTALEFGDRVGCLVFADRVLGYLPPQRGAAGFSSLLEFAHHFQPVGVESDYAGAFSFLQSRHRRHSLLLLLTDLGEPGSSHRVLEQLSSLAGRHARLVVTVGDTALQELAELPLHRPEDVYQRVWGGKLLREKETSLALLRAGGVAALDAPPTALNEAVLGKYLTWKRQGHF